MPHRTLTQKQKKLAAAAAMALFLGFWAVVGWCIGRPMLRFVGQPERFKAWVDASGVWGRLAFVGMVALQVVVALIPGEPLEIGAGYAFGAVEGTLLCLAGIFVGSALVLLLVRRFGVGLVEVFFKREQIAELRFLRTARRLHTLVFLVFFIPGTPKDLLTYFVALTPIRAGSYLWLTTVARLPSIVTSTVGGDALGGQNYLWAVIIFGATALISGGGLLAWRALCRRQAHRDARATAPAKVAAQPDD